MTRKFSRALPLFLALLMLLTLSVSAKKPGKKEPEKICPVIQLKTVVTEAPSVEKVGVASCALSTLKLVGGSAEDEFGNPVPGVFVWDDPTATMKVGIHEVTVRFVPFWYKSYAECTCTVKVHAYKLNLTVKQLPTVEEKKLAVGKSVSELTLYDGVAVNHFEKGRPAIAGHFEFVDPDQKFDKAGTYECAVVFKPDNSELYNDATVTYARNADRTFKDAYISVTVG